MSIDLLTQPGSGTPTTNTDYTNQNLLINGSITAPGASILTDWTSTAAAPAIAQGAYIYHANNLYTVSSSDYTILGTPSAGLNYIKLSVSGTNLTATWVTTFSGYTYSESQNGWYSGTDQILFNGDYLVGAAHNRYLAINKLSPYHFVLGNGLFLSDDKAITAVGGAVSTGGDDFQTNGGVIDTVTSAGLIIARGGVASRGQAIDTEGGTLSGGITTATKYRLQAVNNLLTTVDMVAYNFNGKTAGDVYSVFSPLISNNLEYITILTNYMGASSSLGHFVIRRNDSASRLQLEDAAGNVLEIYTSGSGIAVGIEKVIFINN